MMGWGYGGFMMVGLVLFGLLILGGGALLLVVLFRSSQGSQPSSVAGTSSISEPTPMEILKARYAKGNISKEQFDAMKLDLDR